MGAWKDIDCSSCGTTSPARTTSDPEFEYCPLCSSSAVDIFSGVYEGQQTNMYDCRHCSQVFTLTVSPSPGYCPTCGSTKLGQFP